MGEGVGLPSRRTGRHGGCVGLQAGLQADHVRPRGSATHFGSPSLAATLHAQASTLGEAAHLHAGQAVLGDESLEAARVLLDEEVAQEQRRLPDVSVEARGAVCGVFAFPSGREAPRPSRKSSHARACVCRDGASVRGRALCKRASVRGCPSVFDRGSERLRLAVSGRELLR